MTGSHYVAEKILSGFRQNLSPNADDCKTCHSIQACDLPSHAQRWWIGGNEGHWHNCCIELCNSQLLI